MLHLFPKTNSSLLCYKAVPDLKECEPLSSSHFLLCMAGCLDEPAENQKINQFYYHIKLLNVIDIKF